MVDVEKIVEENYFCHEKVIHKAHDHLKNGKACILDSEHQSSQVATPLNVHHVDYCYANYHDWKCSTS